jgi:hypothetical protein
MSFEDRSASGSQGICDLFAKFIELTYVDDSWVPSSPRPDLVNGEPPIGSLQFTISEVKNALLQLDSSKGLSPDGVTPLFLKKLCFRICIACLHALQQVIANVYLPR